MSNVERIAELFETARVNVDSGVEIEMGDFVAISESADVSADNDQTNAGYAIPVSDIADAGDTAANREAAADQVIGIAMQESKDGETDAILVAIRAKVKLTLNSAEAVEVGEGLEVHADADDCTDQKVIQGDTSPVAFAVERCASTGTTVYATLATCKFTNQTT